MIWLLACTAEPVLYDERGPHAVGQRALTVDGLDATVWYPAEASGGSAVSEAFLTGDQATTYDSLLAGAPCASTATTSLVDGVPLDGEFPLVVFSHCHECTRFSSFTVAEHLASHGFVVAAADHAGNTLWNALAEDGLPLDESTLAVRVEQHQALLDAALAEPNVDPQVVGAFGHSFGSVTTGMLAQERELDAALGLAAPMENPLLEGVEIDDLDLPLGFLVAIEDNSITELGNELMRTNFDDAATAWKHEVPDAGHWSFSDIVGVTEAIEPGCGEDTRQTDGTEFEYMDAATGRATAAAFTAAFFGETLLADEGAIDRLGWDVEAH